MIDRKGIVSYLLITFALTYAVEFALMAMGVRFETPQSTYVGQLVVAGLMWAPALGAFITAKFVTREGFAGTGLRIGPIRPYIVWALLMPVIYAAIYGVTWALGLGGPDWRLVAFTNTMTAAGGDLTGAPPPGVIMALVFVATTLITPFVNGLFAFGEEFGWRGYLMPKLLPLGKPVAYILMGVIWGMWHMPLILMGYTYPGHPVLGTLTFIVLLTAFGAVLSEVRLRYGSSPLAGWLHGLFNSQRLGLWALLFWGLDKALLGGYSGVVGIAVWGVVAAIVLTRRPADTPGT
jgi:membrane protease YdiL (CAAX protease family)